MDVANDVKWTLSVSSSAKKDIQRKLEQCFLNSEKIRQFHITLLHYYDRFLWAITRASIIEGLSFGAKFSESGNQEIPESCQPKNPVASNRSQQTLNPLQKSHSYQKLSNQRKYALRLATSVVIIVNTFFSDTIFGSFHSRQN